MPLLTLPNELLLLLASFLTHPSLFSLLLTNRRLASLLTPLLHSFAILDKNGATALQWAARRGHNGLISLLLSKHFKIDYQGPMGRTGTALYRAVGAQRESAVQLLIQHGAAVNIQDAWGYTALHVASTRRSLSILTMLLAAGADVRIPANDGKTALHLAASDKNEGAVRILLEHGADPNVRDSIGATPLHLAIYDHKPLSVVVVGLLLGCGADVAVRGSDGRTALYLAARTGNEEVVELVLSHGGGESFDVLDMNGMTALHAAAFLRHGGVVRQLLDKGANVEFNLAYEDYNGHTALDLAAMQACQSETKVGDYRETICLLLDKRGPGVYAVKTLNQVLLWAAEKGHEDIFQLLLENGADVAAKHPSTPWTRMDGRFGDTVLHVAAEFGKENVVRMVLERGVDVNAKNGSGNTPLDLVLRTRYLGYDRGERPANNVVMRMLQEHGAMLGDAYLVGYQ